MDEQDKKVDPISNLYFNPLEGSEKFSDYLFYISAALSFIIFLVDKNKYSHLYDNLEIIFILCVVLSAITGLAIRLYFAPRAQSKRFQDFVSHAYKVNLTHDRTEGYYNNNATENHTRLPAQLLENVFHSKSTTHEMTIRARKVFGFYLFALLILLLNRASNLEVVSIVAQIFFGEQITSKYFRLEWLRQQFDQIFIDLYRLLESKPTKEHLEGASLEILQRYEVVKATTGITLSKEIFLKNNPKLSKEWKTIVATLKI